MYKLKYSEAARLDIIDAKKYYARSSLATAASFQDSLKQKLELVRINPHLGVQASVGINATLLARFPYRIFYNINTEQKKIVVLAVISTYRDYEHPL